MFVEWIGYEIDLYCVVRLGCFVLLMIFPGVVVRFAYCRPSGLFCG